MAWGHVRKNHTSKDYFIPDQCTSPNQRSKAGSRVQIQHCQQQIKQSKKVDDKHIWRFTLYTCIVWFRRGEKNSLKSQIYVWFTVTIHISFTVTIHNLIYSYSTQSDLLLQYTISFTVTEHNLIYCYNTQFHLLLQYTILHLELIIFHGQSTWNLWQLVLMMQRVTYFIPWANTANCISQN